MSCLMCSAFAGSVDSGGKEYSWDEREELIYLTSFVLSSANGVLRLVVSVCWLGLSSLDSSFSQF